MKRLSIGLLCALLGLAVALSTHSVRSARAASSDSASAGMQLSRLVLSKSTYQAMTKQMIDSMMKASGQPADEKTQQKLSAVMAEALPYDEMLQLNAKVYSDRFKDSEIQDIISFYKTPTGAKLVRELPNISGEVGALVGKIIPERLPALLKKHGLTP